MQGEIMHLRKLNFGDLMLFYGIGSKRADVSSDDKQLPHRHPPEASQVCCRSLEDREGDGGGFGV